MVRDVCLLALEGVYQECQRVTIKRVRVCIKRVRVCIKRVRVGVYVIPDVIQIIHQYGDVFSTGIIVGESFQGHAITRTLLR